MNFHDYNRVRLPGWLYLFLAIALRNPVRASGIAYWYLTRRRVRARNRLRDAANALLDPYKTWIRIVEREQIATLLTARSGVQEPKFTFLVNAPQWADSAALARTVASIFAQTSSNWEIVLTSPIVNNDQFKPDPRMIVLRTDTDNAAVALDVALREASGAFIIPVPPGAVFSFWALAGYQDALNRNPAAEILYGDEDRISEDGRRTLPWFKPEWDPEMLLAQDYISGAFALATPLARAAGPVAADLADCARYALLLAAVVSEVRVVHVARVLCHHCGAQSGDDVPARLRAVSRQVAARRGEIEPGPFNTVRVRWPLQHPEPTVTIVVPTRDGVDLLEACVGGVLRATQYSNFTVLVVDNGSVDAETHAWFEKVSLDHRVTVLRYDKPYNYSAINNFAVSHAASEYICLLNNDTEVIDGAWLRELMRYAVRPGVGAVGAKLLYPDRTIQHAGVVVGLGGAAGHAHRALPDDAPGYFAHAHVPHHASAVTAACLVVAREKFIAVGGFDETGLQIAYNDVDLCLKFEKAGWRNVYAPQSVLIHHESKSRGLDMSPEHFARYTRELNVLRERWGTVDFVDPSHHPMLDRSSELYRVQL